MKDVLGTAHSLHRTCFVELTTAEYSGTYKATFNAIVFRIYTRLLGEEICLYESMKDRKGPLLQVVVPSRLSVDPRRLEMSCIILAAAAVPLGGALSIGDVLALRNEYMAGR